MNVQVPPLGALYEVRRYEAPEGSIIEHIPQEGIGLPSYTGEAVLTLAGRAPTTLRFRLPGATLRQARAAWVESVQAVLSDLESRQVRQMLTLPAANGRRI